MSRIFTFMKNVLSGGGSGWVRKIRMPAGYLWVMPASLLYFVFKLGPMIGGLYLALLRWDGMSSARFVGLRNFQHLFEDEIFVDALLNNARFALGTVVGKTFLSLFLALILHEILCGRTFYRTALFMPVLMSFVVVGLLWSWMFNPQFGLVNSLLRTLNLDFMIQDWLGDSKVALWSLMFVDIWKYYGFHMVIFMAGLQTIPENLYEAAAIDGASRLRQITSITIPLLKPVILVNVTLSLMGAFNVFDIPYVMTEGGPAHSTMVTVLYMYIQGFKFFRFGYASAISYGLLILVAVIVLVWTQLMTSQE